MKIEFNVPGKVQAKQRPRFNGKFAYTPKETIAYENWVKTCYLEKHRDVKPLENPLKVKIIAYYEVPKSASKKKKLQMLHNEIFPTVKPDTDNIAKGILDSLNGIAYLDDKQVVKLEVEKYYSNSGYVAVLIEEMEVEDNARKV
jgi:Holliday junction resolvase RusA-like endonuclease